ncbi:hypothetical protein KEM55_002747 [Ascosphaera atra]|nr:hypothetical protein KEM55_002747 [Ascosphaera atra]
MCCGTTPEDEAKELARHDARTYGELVEFSRALDRELCLMGVPFFATKFELVKPPDSPVDPTGKTIRVQELGELQKKMLTFLEELVSE